MFKIIFALILSFILVLHSVAGRQYTAIIESPGKTDWGDWGNAEFCAYPQYAIGFRSKVEASCGTGNCDDTAMNAIQLLCSDWNTISSTQGPWGDWDSDFRTCNYYQRLIGFNIKGEIMQFGSMGDDTAANAIQMICMNGEVLSSLEGEWGDWDVGNECPINTSICGIQTQVESRQGGGDDTALNNVRFFCCG